jgi:hypothetical protein
MMKLSIGGSVDIQKIHRLVRNDEVLIGYPDGVEHHSTKHPDVHIQNSDMARALHFGTRYTPARPWLYDAIVSVREELKIKLRKMHQKIIERGEAGVTGEYSLEGIGAFIVGAVQRLVRSGYYKGTAPNAPSTLKAKFPADTPLIDEGFLMQSTTFITRKHPPKLTAKKIEVSGETPG